MNSGEPLHVKYRPLSLHDVIGQDAIVKSLTKLLATDRVPHCFLLTGPSGCGKTTLGRIIASNIGCHDIIEVDAARYAGADDMRTLLTSAQYRGLAGVNGRKFLLIDEVHALSKQAWQSLLKSCEEPPDHLYIGLCTTETGKVPATIKTRSTAYDVKPVSWEILSEYMTEVAKEEKIKATPEIIGVAARQAAGSVRQALVYLSFIDGISDKKEALSLMEASDDSEGGPADLPRLLLRGANWVTALAVLKRLEDQSAETIRLTTLAYISAVQLNKQKADPSLLAILNAFSLRAPYNASEKSAPLLLALAELLE